MKFKEMSWKELKEDFKKILDSFTTEDLVSSLSKYKVEGDKKNGRE